MKVSLPLTLLPIEDDGFHLKLHISVNGKEANVILDTGASKTVFDENRIVQFIDHDNFEDQERLSSGIGTNTMKSKCVSIEILKLGSIKITGYHATILDLKHVNQSYEKLGMEAVDGILGGDILLKYNAKIDYKKKVLVLEDSK